MKPIVKTVGIILFRKVRGEILYLLLHHHGPYWNFPKGRMEKREVDEKQTAFRETQEEAGISKDKIDLIKGFQASFEYSFLSKYKEDYGQKVTKKAIFFLGQSKTDKVVISHEHIGFGWFPYEQAHKKLYYKNGQAVLLQARRFFEK